MDNDYIKNFNDLQTSLDKVHIKLDEIKLSNRQYQEAMNSKSNYSSSCAALLKPILIVASVIYLPISDKLKIAIPTATEPASKFICSILPELYNGMNSLCFYLQEEIIILGKTYYNSDHHDEI